MAREIWGVHEWYQSINVVFVYRSRIHERTILSRFLGIILRVLRLEVSFLEGGMGE
jgi:hypothetical protein